MKSIARTTTRERVLTLLTLGALLETGWTVYLGWRLPRVYVADHWDAAWVGLDVAQIVLLLGAAWAAWKRRAVLVFFAVAEATLLLTDAWFDITTARHGDILESVLTAALIEIPSAIALLWVARRVATRLLRSYGEPRPAVEVTLPSEPGLAGDTLEGQ